jgi:hypothetical protein
MGTLHSAADAASGASAAWRASTSEEENSLAVSIVRRISKSRGSAVGGGGGGEGECFGEDGGEGGGEGGGSSDGGSSDGELTGVTSMLVSSLGRK